MGLVEDEADTGESAAATDNNVTEDGTPVTVAAVNAAAEQAGTTPQDASASNDAQAETEQQPAVSEQAVASANGLHITFNDVSWVNINDSTNTQLLNGNQDAGTEVTLEGTPPIRLVIGNASAVDMSWQGEPVDLNSIAGGTNVARFTLGE